MTSPSSLLSPPVDEAFYCCNAATRQLIFPFFSRFSHLQKFFLFFFWQLKHVFGVGEQSRRQWVQCTLAGAGSNSADSCLCFSAREFPELSLSRSSPSLSSPSGSSALSQLFFSELSLTQLSPQTLLPSALSTLTCSAAFQKFSLIVRRIGSAIWAPGVNFPSWKFLLVFPLFFLMGPVRGGNNESRRQQQQQPG